MELSKQVCSLELAKKLKELGFKQESLFVYQKITHEGSRKISLELEMVDNWEYFKSPNGYISAYTVSELGEMLPFGVTSLHIDTRFSGENGESDYTKLKGGNWLCRNENRGKRKNIYADTEANARAKILIYLKENNLI